MKESCFILTIDYQAFIMIHNHNNAPLLLMVKYKINIEFVIQYKMKIESIIERFKIYSNDKLTSLIQLKLSKDQKALTIKNVKLHLIIV